MYYEIEELMPIVAELSIRYTGYESTSITYEKARQLMTAILYCMQQCEEERSSLIRQGLRAREAYDLGYQILIERVKRVKDRYNHQIDTFCDYGNKNYRDTVIKAIPGFFLYYDPVFAPQETIITMDYPIFGLNMELTGINIIEQYLNAIWEEQRYLQQYETYYVISVLRQFHPKYENEYFNLKEIFDRYSH